MNKLTRQQYKALPEIVKIGQREYSIILSSEDKDVQLNDAYGYTLRDFDTIVLNDNMSAGRLRSTLLHELLHAIGMVNSNRESQVPEREEDEAYEDYADRWEHFYLYLFAEPIVQLLRDNPELVTFFTLTNSNKGK